MKLMRCQAKVKDNEGRMAFTSIKMKFSTLVLLKAHYQLRKMPNVQTTVHFWNGLVRVVFHLSIIRFKDNHLGCQRKAKQSDTPPRNSETNQNLF